MEPGIQYFQRQLASSLQHSLSAFKEARFFSPYKLQVLQPDAIAIDNLNVFPFLNSKSVLDGLKAELPNTYLAKSADVDPSFSLSNGANGISHVGQLLLARSFLCSLHQQLQNGFFRS